MLAYAVFGPLWPFCYILSIIVGSAWSLIRPPNPFSSGFLGGPRKPLAQHEDSALRVLSFFCSQRAHRLIWQGSVMMLLLGAVLWPTVFIWKPTAEPAGLVSTSVVAFMCWFMFFGITTFYQFVLLARYALRHWEEVQRDYEPWPVTRVYELGLHDRWMVFLEQLARWRK